MPAVCTTQYAVQQFFFKTLGHYSLNPSNSLSFENSFDFLLSKKYSLKCIYTDAYYKIGRQMCNNLSNHRRDSRTPGTTVHQPSPQRQPLIPAWCVAFQLLFYLHISVCTFRAIFFKLWLSPESV